MEQGSASNFAKAGWFIAIWLGSVLALGLVAYGIRFLLK